MTNLASNEKRCGTAQLKLGLWDPLHTREVDVHELHSGIQSLVVELKALLHLYHPVYEDSAHTHRYVSLHLGHVVWYPKLLLQRNHREIGQILCSESTHAHVNNLSI